MTTTDVARKSGLKECVYAALAGVAAAAVALGLGELLAAFVSARSAPLVAVGGVVIDKVPEAGKQLAIELFGTNDKLALQVGTVVLLCLFAAGLGVLALRWFWAAAAGIGVFGLIGVLSALTRNGANVAWALPSVIGAAGAGLTLGWLISHLFRAGRVGSGDDVDLATRRRFLRLSGVTIGGGAAVGVLGHMLALRSNVNEARDAVRDELPVPSGRPVSPIPEADVGDLRYITPNDVFYRIDTAIVAPQVDPADWTLSINGRVRNPLTLTFDELLRRPTIERYITLACVSNEVGGDLIGNAKWLGVPIADLLDEVGPDEGADQVVSHSVDGFTAGTPTSVLRDGRDAILAIAMNGDSLPVEHGFPVRMVVPGLYGYVSATKWLQRLELTTFADYDAYWIPRGWAQQAPIKTASRIDRPRGGSQVKAGEIAVAGVAWAQHRGISHVEVRVDGGPWQTATLAATASVDTWRLWSWRWNATRGRHRLEVRATDNAGAIQIEQHAPPAPDGATGLHLIVVEVV